MYLLQQGISKMLLQKVFQGIVWLVWSLGNTFRKIALGVERPIFSESMLQVQNNSNP